MVVKSLLAAIALCLFSMGSMAQNVDAFPGAEGAGRYTTGGRGGKVIHVTNLNDSGTGSLRAAIQTAGARIVVFDVSGTIELEKDLKIEKDDITIAGQTAPGDGICIKNYSFYVGADNVIVRFLRFRLGVDRPDATGHIDKDACWGRNQKNIIIDHCSMSWCTDECVSFYDNENFTLQWCLAAESLRGSLHPKGYHGYGGIWGGHTATFHHNLMAHHDSRNPRMCGSRFCNNQADELVDMRNCVFYNWGSTNSGYAGEGGRYNFVNNYYKSGAATKSSIKDRIFQAGADDGTNNQSKGIYGTFYVNGNYVEGKGENYDWDGIDIDSKNNSAMTKELIKSDTEYTVANVTTETADKAFESVLGYAGASLSRDAIDARIARETRNGQYTYTGSVLKGLGIIDNPEDVGGYPDYVSTKAPADTDGDGMPDAWETANGLNPKSDDSALYGLSTSYTNIEVYINSLVADIMNCTATVSIDEKKGYTDNGSGDDEKQTSNTWNFDVIPDSWGVASGVVQTTQGEYDYNGLTILATNVKSAITTTATAPSGTTTGKYNTGGSGPGFSLSKLASGSVVKIYFTSNSNGSERTITVSDTNSNAAEYSSSSISTPTVVTHTMSSDGNLIVKSNSSINIWQVILTNPSPVNNQVADSRAITVMQSGKISAPDSSYINIFDIEGRCILTSNNSELQASGLPRGTYLAKAIWNDGYVKTKKFTR